MLGAGEAAEQLRDRLSGHLAEEVPERDVERGVAAHLGAGGAEADIAGEVLGDAVDGERIAAEQLRREHLVDIGLDGLGMKKVSPSPTRPSSVWTRSQRRLANSSSRMVSIAVIFIAGLRSRPRQSSALTESSKCSRHRRLGRARVAGFDRRGDALMARDIGASLGVSRAALPADPPGLAGDDAEGADDQREHRVARGDGDRSVEGDVVLHHLVRARKGCASRRRGRDRVGLESRRSAASATVRISIVRRTS